MDGARSPLSKFLFTYDNTQIQIAANPTMLPLMASLTQIDVCVNGIWNQKVTITDTNLNAVTLPLGAGKAITLIESVTRKPLTTILGTFLTSVIADTTFVKIVEGLIAEKNVILCDSIGEGCSGNNPAIDGIPGLFYAAGKNIALYGYGYAMLFDFAETAGKITQTVTDIGTLFTYATVTKNLIIQIGTNDAFIQSTPAATFKTWYGNLLDAINVADATIDIYCLSPIHREDAFESLVAEYRTAISECVTARGGYCTYINGQPICTYPGDYESTFHPNSSGQLKIYNALDAVLP